MAIQKEWGVIQMDCYPEYNETQNVVITVHWNLTAVDGEFTGYIYGATSLTIEPDANFTPYADLTEDQVISWVKAALSDERVKEYEAAVSAQIADQKSPKITNPPIPWG